MRCHEVLGIDERATVSDIMLAYENKITSLTDEHTSVSAEQIQAKLCELNSAKDNCIAWTNMDFASKTANRVKEYSADCFSQNRLVGVARAVRLRRVFFVTLLYVRVWLFAS